MANTEHNNGEGHGDHHGPSFLQHHFENPQQQFDSDKLGMWLFLVTEILMFGGLFCAYAIYRANHPEVFIYAHQFLDKTLGGINTIVLIASSMTMAWAVRAAQLNQIKLMRVLLFLTLLGGFGFMGIKYVEYSHKIHEGLLWGEKYRNEEQRSAGHGSHDDDAGHADEADHADTTAQENPCAERIAELHASDSDDHSGESNLIYNPCTDRYELPVADDGHVAAENPCGEMAAQDTGYLGEMLFEGQEPTKIAPAARGPLGLSAADSAAAAAGHELVVEPRNVNMFFAVYFAMTGLHGLHVVAGMIAISCLLIISFTGRLRIGIGNWSLINVSSEINSNYYTPVDLVGLFWHLVDLIWIFLFPLLYLIH